MQCRYCRNDIPLERYDFLISYNKPIICIGCSTESRAVGYMDWGHKTAPQLVMVPSNAKETIRILDRANKRSR